MNSLKFVQTSINSLNYLYLVNITHKLFIFIDLLDSGFQLYQLQDNLDFMLIYQLNDSQIIDSSSSIQQVQILDEQQLTFLTITQYYVIIYQLSQDLSQLNQIYQKQFDNAIIKLSISSNRIVLTASPSKGEVFIYIYNYTSNPYQYNQINMFQIIQNYYNYDYQIIKIQNHDYIIVYINQDKFTLIKINIVQSDIQNFLLVIHSYLNQVFTLSQYKQSKFIKKYLNSIALIKKNILMLFKKSTSVNSRFHLFLTQLKIKHIQLQQMKHSIIICLTQRFQQVIIVNLKFHKSNKLIIIY
ncbi:hypothetical protein TTHERM_000203009 (macronuclear) [Tetrahymena thermophila SB210]|uniref:Uncharacterized protein n=1 Tax=Tetrahymena thermophila (strain SB210) TaxID=312017 RepID=W7XFL4_TETTS|nr:hypothetical protein TTHERM_000203009 [Tetrahymena thermophila SB210]EWS76652.1 hypothetical protein TTHERM_000203009 [Tetrahymena thermophila SB210]|eukprot:XP_012650820.1 hypothetical protein TTHERM_000203009 [Tetrahymena thermophila SB210]